MKTTHNNPEQERAFKRLIWIMRIGKALAFVLFAIGGGSCVAAFIQGQAWAGPLFIAYIWLMYTVLDISDLSDL